MYDRLGGGTESAFLDGRGAPRLDDADGAGVGSRSGRTASLRQRESWSNPESEGLAVAAHLTVERLAAAAPLAVCAVPAVVEHLEVALLAGV